MQALAEHSSIHGLSGQGGYPSHRLAIERVRCSPHTVHHLIGDKSLCEDWNLAALCQRCHLSIQGHVNMFQQVFEFYEISDWFKPHLD